MKPRLLLIAALIAVTGVVTLQFAGFMHPDSGIADAARATLFSSGWLHTYVEHPAAQMGPLAIALSALPEWLYRGVVVALLIPVLIVALPVARWNRLWEWVFRGLLIAVPWADLAWKGHVDDALVIVCGVGIALTQLTKPGRALALFAVAMAAKPTAILLVPLLVGSGWLIVGAALITAMIWAPFALANLTGMAKTGAGVMHVVPGDLWHYLGVREGPPPPWVRPTQLVAALGVGVWGALARQPLLGVLLAFTVKAAMEPNPAPAYSIPLIAFALVCERNRRLPVMSVIAAASFVTSQWALDTGAGSWRLVCLAALIGVAVMHLCAHPGDPESCAPARPIRPAQAHDSAG